MGYGYGEGWEKGQNGHFWQNGVTVAAKTVSFWQKGRKWLKLTEIWLFYVIFVKISHFGDTLERIKRLSAKCVKLAKIARFTTNMAIMAISGKTYPD